MLKNLIVSDFLKSHYGRMARIFLAYGALIALLYFTWKDAWVVIPRATEIYGFFDNIMGWEADSLQKGYSPVSLAASAAVAHTMFFSVYVIVIDSLLYGREIESQTSEVTFARGVGVSPFLSSKILVTTVMVQGSYLLVSAAAGAVFAVRYQVADIPALVWLCCLKAFLSGLVCESFMLFCVMVYTWIRNQTVAAAFLFLYMFVGMIVEMAIANSESILCQLHPMYYWLRICGLSDLPALVRPVGIYSVVTCVVCWGLSLIGLRRKH